MARVTTALGPEALLKALHGIESGFGRAPGLRNAARPLDLDLLAYDQLMLAGDVELPHPRLQDRAFVLAPLCDLAPDWRHPRLGLTALELFTRLPPGQDLRRCAPDHRS